MPDNSGKRVINIIFRIIIAGVFYTGIKAVYNFYMLMAHYQLLQGEELFNRVALLTDDYMFMMLSMIAAIIFNVLTRKQISSKAFTVRTISIVMAFITGCMSFPAIGMFAYIAIAKYPQIMFSKTSGFRSLQEQIFAEEGIEVKPVCSAEEIEVVTGLVENGFGISVLPYMDIVRLHNIVTIPVQTSTWKSKFYIARRKYGIRSEQEEAFFQYWKNASKC